MIPHILFVVIAPTSGGKTTIADYLELEYGMNHFHPLAFWKRQQEEHYGLVKGALDTAEGKNFIPEGMNCTMQQYMVDFYHFMKERDPLFTTRNLRVELPRLLQKQDVCAVAIRNLPEARTIAELKVPLVILNVSRGAATPNSSDEMMEEIRSILEAAADFVFDIENNSTKEDLYFLVDEVNAEVRRRLRSAA